jgi:hypothetical protein
MPSSIRVWAPIQKGAVVMGVILLLIGALGFVPGVTHNLNELRWATTDSSALFVGVLQVSVLLNLIHIATGVAGIVLARGALGARNFLLYGAAFYLLLFMLGVETAGNGILTAPDSANFIPVNAPDNFLHLTFALVMGVLGVVLYRGSDWQRTVEEHKATL